MLSSVLVVLLSLTTPVASTEVDSSSLGCPLIGQEYGIGSRDSEKRAFSQLQPLIGKRFSAIDTMKEYKYSVGIFRDAVDGFKNVGVLQESLLDKRVHVLGFYNSTRIYSGDDCVVIEYLHGEKYHSHCGGKQTGHHYL
ncbi:hypothetical protein SNE40_015595 [Patella caerulea]|uniref:Uncharacterized protein n=1 Tax=Patella caerulea TaxID=87958 RepID=A0AAN8JIB1_PATCE